MAVLSRTLVGQVKTLATLWPAILRGDADAIHRGRVATRRVREALGVARAAAPGQDGARTVREVRRITRALGPVRELDVLLSELDADPPRVTGTREALAFARRTLERARVDRFAEMTATLTQTDRAAIGQRIGAIARALDGVPVHGEWRRALAGRIDRRARTLASAVRRCGTIYAPDRLHAVRLAVKKLRYSLELASQAGIGDLQPTIDALRGVQGELGRLHDRQVLERHLEDMAGDPRAGALAPRLARLGAAVARACREQHAALLPQLPALGRLARGVRDRHVAAEPGRPTMLRAGAPLPSVPRRAAR